MDPSAHSPSRLAVVCLARAPLLHRLNTGNSYPKHCRAAVPGICLRCMYHNPITTWGRHGDRAYKPTTIYFFFSCPIPTFNSSFFASFRIYLSYRIFFIQQLSIVRLLLCFLHSWLVSYSSHTLSKSFFHFRFFHSIHLFGLITKHGRHGNQVMKISMIGY